MYLVHTVTGKHRDAPVKRLVRRPPLPLVPTSAPLDDDNDCDAATTLPPISPNPPSRSHLWEKRAGSASPLDDDFDAVTYTAAPGGDVDSTLGVYGRRRDDTTNRHCDAGVERRVGEGATSAAVWHGRDISSPISLPAKKVGTGGKAMGAGAGPSVSPRGGQSFEIVNRRVVEDGPERTVLISTWREHVAEATDGGREGREIYYVNAMDYAAEEAKYQSRVATPLEQGEDGQGVRNVLPLPRRFSLRHSREELRSIPDEGSRWERVLSDVRFVVSLRFVIIPNSHIQRKPTQQRTYGSDDTQATTPLTRSSTAQSWNSAPDGMSGQRRDRSPIRWRSLRHGKPNGYRDYVPAAETSARPRTSTPIPRSPDRRVHTPTLHGLSPNRTYTAPRPKAVPPPPFHPTRSGSTISTIPSQFQSAREGVGALESVLASCDPPLVHLAPMLAKLGILHEGHLRAVARLSDETRDREVREEALKLGVTVMEWAMLVDRLQML